MVKGLKPLNLEADDFRISLNQVWTDDFKLKERDWNVSENNLLSDEENDCINEALEIESNLLRTENMEINLDDTNFEYDLLYYEKVLPQRLTHPVINEKNKFDNLQGVNILDSLSIQTPTLNINKGKSTILELEERVFYKNSGDHNI